MWIPCSDVLIWKNYCMFFPRVAQGSYPALGAPAGSMRGSPGGCGVEGQPCLRFSECRASAVSRSSSSRTLAVSARQQGRHPAGQSPGELEEVGACKAASLVLGGWSLQGCFACVRSSLCCGSSDSSLVAQRKV